MNLEFKEPAISDRDPVRKILSRERKISTESTFGTCYLWSHYYRTKICIYEDMLIKKSGNKTIMYECPSGAGSTQDFKKALNAITDDAKENKYSNLIFNNLVDSEIYKLEEFFPGKFEFIPVRNNFEYIYKVNDLALLKGKKYHGKRNHISKFSKMFDWRYKPIIPDEKDRYLAFFEKWFGSRALKEPYQKLGEYRAIQKSLQNYKTLELSGGVIEVGGEIIACTIGERINSDVFLIYFEKALNEFSGAYGVINNEFCKELLLNNYKLVNREEDLGIPGLRKAKLSYRPAILLPKYKAVFKA